MEAFKATTGFIAREGNDTRKGKQLEKVQARHPFLDRHSIILGADFVTMVRAWDKKTLSEALAFEPQLLAKFAVAMCELLVERLRDTARRV